MSLYIAKLLSASALDEQSGISLYINDTVELSLYKLSPSSKLNDQQIFEIVHNITWSIYKSVGEKKT